MGQDIAPFQAISLSRRAHELKAAGQRILHMEFGQPSTGAPGGAIARAHEVLDAEAMGYWESLPLKERICRHYREGFGVELSPRRLVITCGASPALVLALATAFSPGARIAMARPGYVAYRNTVRALNMEPVEIACGADVRFQLSAAALEALEPAPNGVIIASPANPTGTIIPKEELAAIAEVCKRRGIRIISDEIYHGLSYGPKIHSMLEFAPDAYVVNSFSKYFSMAGWRLGWLVSPEEGVARTGAYIGNLFLTAPSLAQHAGLVAMDSRAELEGHVEVYRRNRELLLNALPGLGLEKIAPPDGAFYIYADVSRFTDDSLSFCMKLLEETGVATAPGVDFDPVDGNRFVRFSFALSTPEIEEAIGRITPWFRAQPLRLGY
ncbi:aminotransferase class I/II-fold pyridoxal phosphate-dependent enzyme [Hyphomonas sp. WL0036]|uniref:pyridoxal phosphate-dependent aminotransferase n=1 Tax=Hyphomonas sediminis TaxID=2866160 RepID=UPI001C811A1D|nr:aminotransferase class I/II-fold pyridoxal phosphate-dependent enzyme [Hyphomonas sediminis]MBY9068385.1 aminotransferase class I/II-fold pyridoxal phosphate-dependent enzyme [Hyphomonas sediminis]